MDFFGGEAAGVGGGEGSAGGDGATEGVVAVGGGGGLGGIDEVGDVAVRVIMIVGGPCAAGAGEEPADAASGLEEGSGGDAGTDRRDACARQIGAAGVGIDGVAFLKEQDADVGVRRVAGKENILVR